ncbi:DUF2256 domain-containing protein [Pseudomonas entomophila]|uniref:DUF2256 domain-containing protein n=1 Tax=Pseudomonas entomophila TaxID=312306 RepID=UPI001BCAA2BB|nr:DUF2256 domain-containing protein [Pseudomonas entomophila]QVM93874.1 DUF2256 domain-containing protein [Pseudomonas entomophila]
MSRNTPVERSKICTVCGRPFTWRKRWARCWEEVKYCSQRCRRAAPRRRSKGRGQGCRLRCAWCSLSFAIA